MSFCVKCGVDIDKTINGLCIDCFLEDRSLTSLPHHIDVNVCTNCDSFQMGEYWVESDRRIIAEQVTRNALEWLKDVDLIEAECTSLQQDEATFLVTVDSVLSIADCETEDVASTLVRFKNTVCKRCSRLLGNYYESIIQIRSGGRTVSDELRNEVLERVESFVANQARTNRHLFITKMELVIGGVDVYLSSIPLGKTLSKALCDQYCAEGDESAKLVGQDRDGLDMYRVTYLVRLPDFHVGDVILYEGRHFKLSRVSSNAIKAVDLMTFKERNIKRSDSGSIKVHERHSDLREATLVSHDALEVQVLHPVSYRTVDLRVPEDAEIGETVKVTDIEDTLYFVP